jgi:hypothetical protein
LEVIEMIVLGIDPGIRNSGAAVVEFWPGEFKVVDFTTIKEHPSLPVDAAIGNILAFIDKIITVYDVTDVAIEDMEIQAYRGFIPKGWADMNALVSAIENQANVKGLRHARQSSSIKSKYSPAEMTLIMHAQGIVKMNKHEQDSLRHALWYEANLRAQRS